MLLLPGRRPKFIYLISCLACLVFLFRFFIAKDRGPTTPLPRILLVSAFYRSPNAKHSDYAYSRWIERYLGQITTDIYFFTSPELEDFILEKRPSSLPFYLNTTFATPFSIPPLHGLEAVYSKQQHDLDPYKEKHSPDVYAVWNGKPYFVTQAIQNLEREGKVYDYVFWNDAGSFRDEHWYTEWPDPRRVEQVWADAAKLQGRSRSTSLSSDLVFFPLTGIPSAEHQKWKEDDGPISDAFSQGSFFGGTPSAMQWFSQTFYAYHDHYLSKSLFVGIDQNVFNTLFLLFPDKFIAMDYSDVPLMDIDLYGACCWRWWYYHFWLGDEEGGEKVREMWRDKLKDVKEGKGDLKSEQAKLKVWEDTWWRVFWREDLVPSRERSAPVRLMTTLLRKQFGRTWTPPKRHVHVDL
ncbi:hypothetical protein JOM56_002805 [Amanita muscaria]